MAEPLLLFANAKLKQQSHHSSVRVKWLSHYSSAQQILLVGEGDFSFSLALANAFGSADNLVATSLDSYGLPFPSSLVLFLLVSHVDPNVLVVSRKTRFLSRCIIDLMGFPPIS
ncbi:hypothetical protein C4D60_Mb03t03960 [Musa balbisiana]|uniref:25S rRNA (uridine-N(3))-methyltransferase BMT5-like domain-containing protein n=1 Tax=Musa balbisiana TaxID=52838 RepID=A0A4S8J7C7_MUSBA|nr:hypothetical protein C4D60_Mb03t03960 [Musa balbisiana]